MPMTRALPFAVLLLAGCQQAEVTALCATYGDPAAELDTVAFGAGLSLVQMNTDSASGQTTLRRLELEAPALPDLWQLADPTFRALPRVESVPCGLSDISTVTFTFADDSIEHRETSCEGNALARLTGQVFEAAAPPPGQEGTGPQVLALVFADRAAACARAAEAL